LAKSGTKVTPLTVKLNYHKEEKSCSVFCLTMNISNSSPCTFPESEDAMR